MNGGIPELRERKQTDRYLSFGIYLVLVLVTIGLAMAVGIGASLTAFTGAISGMTTPTNPLWMLQAGGWVAITAVILMILSILHWWYQWELYKRRNQHMMRATRLRTHVAHWLKNAHGIDLTQSATASPEAAAHEQARGVGFFVVWVILTYLTGVVGFILMLIAWYWMTRDYALHEHAELSFYREVSGKLQEKDVAFDAEPRELLPHRSMALYIILTIIPFVNVIWSIWWLYVLFRDPNTHFSTHEHWESQLEALVNASAGPETGSATT